MQCYIALLVLVLGAVEAPVERPPVLPAIPDNYDEPDYYPDSSSKVQSDQMKLLDTALSQREEHGFWLGLIIGAFSGAIVGMLFTITIFTFGSPSEIEQLPKGRQTK